MKIDSACQRPSDSTPLSPMTSSARRVVLASILCCACDAGAATPGGPGEVVHPRDEDRLSSHTSAPVIRIAHDPDTSLPAWLAPLARFDEAAAVGFFDAGAGSESLVFGSLIDAQVDPAGRVLLLDKDASAVRVLDPALNPIGRVGRSGDGPGEFRRPTEIFAVEDSGFSILDTGASQVDRFVRTDAGFEPSGGLGLSALPYPRAACYIGEDLFARGLRLTAGGRSASFDDLRTTEPDSLRAESGAVHQIDAEGQVVRSFSEEYHGVLPFGGRIALALDELLSEGVMVCGEGKLWLASVMLGEVHALDAAGNLHWIARVADYDFPGYRFLWSADGEPLQGSASLNLDLEAGNHAVETLRHLALISPELLAVGLQRRRVGSKADGYPVSFTYRTYLLDPQSGEFLGAFQADHEVIGGGHGRAVLYRAQPYPQIVVVHLER